MKKIAFSLRTKDEQEAIWLQKLCDRLETADVVYTFDKKTVSAPELSWTDLTHISMALHRLIDPKGFLKNNDELDEKKLKQLQIILERINIQNLGRLSGQCLKTAKVKLKNR